MTRKSNSYAKSHKNNGFNSAIVPNKFFSTERINKFVLPQYNLLNSNISLIKYKNTDKERAIYKVSNGNKCYSLKKVYYSEKELLFIYSALEWLYRYNINVPKLIKTKFNSRFALYNNMIFILSPWLKGEKCDFDNVNHLTLSLKTLANLHKCSKKFTPICGSTIKKGLTNQYIQVLKHFEELNRISTLAYNSKDRFSKSFINHFDDILYLNEISLKIASSIKIEDLSISLTHGDYVNKNILINNSKVSVIDFDKCKYDYIAHDISYFLRRLLKRTNTKWDISLCINLLRAYNKINPLSKSDLKYIISYICYPQKYFKLVKAYYKTDYYSKKPPLQNSERNNEYSKKMIEKMFINCFTLMPCQIQFAKKIIEYFDMNDWIL